MLYITAVRTRDSEPGEYMPYRCGERYTETAHAATGYKHANPQDVVSAQADGHELDEICNQFSTWVAEVRTRIYTIPMHRTAAVQRWFGDHAKFIAANLKL